MISVTIVATAHTGKGEELAAAWNHCAKLALTHDPGCKTFHVSRSRDNPDQVLVFEIYGSKEAFDAHSTSELAKELLPTLVPLVSGEPRIYVADLLTG